MRVLVEGSGGPAGWPQPGCRCASCLRMSGNPRARSTIIVDDLVRLGVEGAGGAGAGGAGAGGAGAGAAGAGGAGAGGAGAGGAGAGGAGAEGYRVLRIAGG